MRNRDLHDALRNFALESAKLLRSDQEAGAELEFDLDEGAARGGPTLYHYRPLTGRFVAERWDRLRALATCAPAAELLGSGAAAYLRMNGLRGVEAEPALQALLERLYEDVTDLTFPEERFERVYREVERTLYEETHAAAVLVPVPGLILDGSERVELGDGMSLVRGETTDAPDEALWGEADGGEANTLLMLTRDVGPDDALPVDEARERFPPLLTGLRLWKRGGIALGTLAWRRAGDGRWQPFELEASGVARSEPWVLVEGEDADLIEFLRAIDGFAAPGTVSWALARFEMGCGRPFESEALSDYLLALRALIDDGRSGLALRVAVLCAEDAERRQVQRRLELAQALERFVMGDGASDPYLDAIGSDSPQTLVDEVERHLRALLRDVLCGYLDPDLRAVADDLLLDQPEPFEIRAHRGAPATAVGAATHAPEPEPEHEIAVTRSAAESVVTDDPAAESGALDDPADERAMDDATAWSAPV